MRRRHDMPFGAELVAGGGARFRLWAPAARQVELLIDDGSGERARRLEARPNGWYESVEPGARAGWRYRYRIDERQLVPDPASRHNPEDVHAASELVDPQAFEWRDGEWRGRPWSEAVIYELHTGTFTPQGTFQAIEGRLDHLVALGVTALELMPIADFPGRWGWGYDGVLPFAPDSSYGRPEHLKALVQAAHRRGLMVFLDVVYNHFGPEGNYLHLYAPQFFSERHQTPWGKALNFDGPGSETVRAFFIHNALYWLEEFHFDGLRLDAVHAIRDESQPDFLSELARAVREGPGSKHEIHLVLENDLNSAQRLERAFVPSSNGARHARRYTAQWNDDFHHAAHCLLTGERDGYYADYTAALQVFARCLAQGFGYQGEPSGFRGHPRGEPSVHLPPEAFVHFLQNHDQIGNRAFGERLSQLAGERELSALAAVLLLAPSPPLLFMGEEFGAATPFLFFTDFSGDLAEATRNGRLQEFARFERFRDPEVAARIPDPLERGTFESSKLDWTSLAQPPHAAWLKKHRALIELRQREIVPLLPRIVPGSGAFRLHGEAVCELHWRTEDGLTLVLLVNASAQGGTVDPMPRGRILYATPGAVSDTRVKEDRQMPPWSVSWRLVPARSAGN